MKKYFTLFLSILLVLSSEGGNILKGLQSDNNNDKNGGYEEEIVDFDSATEIFSEISNLAYSVVPFSSDSNTIEFIEIQSTPSNSKYRNATVDIVGNVTEDLKITGEISGSGTITMHILDSYYFHENSLYISINESVSGSMELYAEGVYGKANIGIIMDVAGAYYSTGDANYILISKCRYEFQDVNTGESESIDSPFSDYLNMWICLDDKSQLPTYMSNLFEYDAKSVMTLADYIRDNAEDFTKSGNLYLMSGDKVSDFLQKHTSDKQNVMSTSGISSWDNMVKGISFDETKGNLVVDLNNSSCPTISLNSSTTGKMNTQLIVGTHGSMSAEVSCYESFAFKDINNTTITLPIPLTNVIDFTDM